MTLKESDERFTSGILSPSDASRYLGVRRQTFHRWARGYERGERCLQREFSDEYVPTAPELATDGIDVLWDFPRSRDGHGLIEARTGQHVFRER
jgi:hypothetical protein